ncbi:MAG: class I SAM-dependent methyltransferase [Gammaproteobacteria bacterium]|nr:class I SAM-dependent methyltransferase [Gammaproteobacteria bacterium]
MSKQDLFHATLMPDQDWWQALWPDPAAVLRTVGIKPGMDVVDLCCGDGLFTRPMCELVFPAKTWALDLDADLLEQAQKACRDNSNLHVIAGDARELVNTIDHPVDFIFIANTFHGVPEKTELARAAHQSLREDGHFAVVNWSPQPREETTVLGQPRGPDTELRMHPDDVQRFVEAAGFKLEQLVDVGPYHYGAVFLKV